MSLDQKLARIDLNLLVFLNVLLKEKRCYVIRCFIRC